jgi:hypothetical protein
LLAARLDADRIALTEPDSTAKAVAAAMCVFQAAASELFTGRTPDTSRMLSHVETLLRDRTPTPLWNS